MLRAAVRILPVGIMANDSRCSSCCGWFCGLCCCCCLRYRAKRETSPLLSTASGGGGRRQSEEMSRVRVTASPDGQSEIQTVEVKVRTRGDDEKDETNGSVDRVKRRSREVVPRDPGTSTTFVRGSSGRSSWRMVPNSSKRQSATSDTEKTTVVTQETEVGEVKVELVSTATTVQTPPPPPKAYRLTQTFEEDEELVLPPAAADVEEGEEDHEGVIVHTSSFSFASRDGKLIDTR